MIFWVKLFLSNVLMAWICLLMLLLLNLEANTLQSLLFMRRGVLTCRLRVSLIDMRNRALWL